MADESVVSPASSRASSASKDNMKNNAHLTEASTDPSLSGSSVQYRVAEEGGPDENQMSSENAEGLPSRGSELHASGQCSRCCFFFKGRCRNGLNCQFCHMPHERRSRGRGCRGHGTQKRKLAAAALANTELSEGCLSSVPRSVGEDEGIRSTVPATDTVVEPGLVRPAPPPGLLKVEAKINTEQTEEAFEKTSTGQSGASGSSEAPDVRIRGPPGLEATVNKADSNADVPKTKSSTLLSTLPSTVPTTVPTAQACLSVPAPGGMATNMVAWSSHCDARRPEGVWVSTTPVADHQAAMGLPAWADGGYANNTLCTVAATTPTTTGAGQRASGVLLATPGNATNVASKAKQIFGTTPGGIQAANPANRVVLAPAHLPNSTEETGEISPKVDAAELPRLLGFSGGRYGVNGYNSGKVGTTTSTDGGATRAPPPGRFTVPDKKAATSPVESATDYNSDAAPKKVTSAEIVVGAAGLDPSMPVKKRVPAW
mmetsp:Transcript_95359/g.199493  ORF Transcript_95359/g.199493 Transcript_95359/m.199493 type:complete len:486 (-) Transcript_95359:91-1548(-)|eukprot:CAMPEP_0206470344 /NCGR_PEP_ID=MMETSP0324_2-20121206/30872_1 /ASSEMBLY_ACC=CAM_ASM_000836 /TAXON_ID=2866 /ORGANISM="Crypthecodinium cohnii, Strain Seligo" /LENGTH=485 /DNA_ID=CAMNT_0053944381 /DNA_START=396 /DNA_END=1853 /DNA_ORIENTATION=+